MMLVTSWARGYSVLASLSWFTLTLLVASPPSLAQTSRRGAGRLSSEISLAGGGLRMSTTSDEQEARAGTAHVGETVNLFNGEAQLEAVDLTIAGRGIDFELKRTYRSKTGLTDRSGFTGPIGNNWDHSYNVFLTTVPMPPDGPPDLPHETSTHGTRTDRLQDLALVLHDGHGRGDRFLYDAEIRAFRRAEYFAILTWDGEAGAPTLESADGSLLTFAPFDGSAIQGKLLTLSDRNDNTITFHYDALGRLERLTDTLGRDVLFAYDADDLLASVTDFAGRVVRYGYYRAGDAHGSAGDLRSATLPAVVSDATFVIPPGHEFPDGKTWTYTYTTAKYVREPNVPVAFKPPARLLHNLLKVIDPRGDIWLENRYTNVRNAADSRFDRVQSQRLGGYQFDFTYKDAAEGKTLVTVNDRAGNVSEYLLDDLGRPLEVRAYTGRALDPNAPTDLELGINPPVAPLRDDDPAVFLTSYAWTADSERQLLETPNLDRVIDQFDDLKSDPRTHGNRLRSTRVAGPNGGDIPLTIEEWEYQAKLRGAPSNLVTAYRDPRTFIEGLPGNRCEYQYDLNGNRTRATQRTVTIGVLGGGSQVVEETFAYNAFGQLTQHVHPTTSNGARVDACTYYEDPADPTYGAMYGYRREEIADALGLALTTTFEYDAVGAITRRIDARHNDAQYLVNQLGQVLIERSPVGPGGMRPETERFYDLCDHLVRVDVLNLDDQGVLDANATLATLHEYDVRGHRTRTCAEAGNYDVPREKRDCGDLPDTEFATTEWVYDANDHVTLLRNGEAVNDDQPDNVVQFLYDERDLLYREIHGGGATQSVTQLDYDGNGNGKRRTAGVGTAPKATQFAHDGFDRLATATDASGNVTTHHYDANGNLTGQLIEGELTEGESQVNVRLWQGHWRFDELDRRVQQNLEYFDPKTGAPITTDGNGDGFVVAHVYFAANSLVLREEDDRAATSDRVYDGAGRCTQITDAKGNERHTSYDACGNAVVISEIEKSDLGFPDQAFTTTQEWDALNRLVTVVDGALNTQRYGHDSRNNRTRLVDGRGSETRHRFDGIDRLVAIIRDLDGDGADGDQLDQVTQQSWDASSRLIGIIDANGNATAFSHDALDRRVGELRADGSHHAWQYDVHDNVVHEIDANGSVIDSTYDASNRIVARQIVPGPGVAADTTSETYKYDGASRLVFAKDNDATVTRGYDSLSHLTRETLGGGVTSRSFDGLGNQLSLSYPSGRQIKATWDKLGQLTTVSEGSKTLASYRYVGATARVERVDRGNGTFSTSVYDGDLNQLNEPDDLGVRRLSRLEDRKAGSNHVLDRHRFAWDAAQQPSVRERSLLDRDLREGETSGGSTHGLDRLLVRTYAYDATSRLAQSTMVRAGSPLGSVGYDLDRAGNRVTVSGGGDAGAYTLDATLPEPADFQQNQYTTTPFDARQYDANGNLIRVTTTGGTRTLSYDYLNRLVRHVDALGKVTTYAYDPLGRRSKRVVDATGNVETSSYWYVNRDVVEEQFRKGFVQTTITYVYGAGGQVLQMKRGARESYLHADAQGSTTMITDASGGVVERYEYGDFGRLLDSVTLTPVGGAPSTVNNPIFYRGLRYDPETSWYFTGCQYLDPRAGR